MIQPATAPTTQTTAPHPQTQTATSTTTTSGTVGAPPAHFVLLSWAQSKSSVIGYYIYRGLSANGPFSRLNKNPEAATLYVDTAVSAGKKYFYAITATNTEGESGYSNIVQAVIPTP